MKTVKFFIAAIAAASISVCFNSCEQQGAETTDGPVVFEGGAISGRYSQDVTLKSGEYQLTGSLVMQAPATLTIEPGTTITAVTGSTENIVYILIEQGAKIMAEGTAAQPITFTATEHTHGAWGGLHICGRAHTNASGSTTSEIGNASYGGTVENDNSGVLKYVKVYYSGFALDSEHEANGITFYGVGSGTTVSYVHVLDGGDDGIEFFGGSVCVDHCVIENCYDDSYDWTEGWNGTAEYIVAYQVDADCDCLMECDNNGDNHDATPVAHPTVRYATFIGNNSSANTRGLRFRAGTEVTLEYALVTGKDRPITLETPQTVASFDKTSNPSSLTNTIISGVLSSGESTGYGAAEFAAATGNQTGYDFSSTFTNVYVGKVGQCGAVDTSNDWTSWLR